MKLSERLTKRLSKQRKPPVPSKNTTETPPKSSSKMLKWAVALSMLGNVILAIWMVATPNPTKAPADLTKYTQHDLGKANRINADMKKSDVATLMGEPAIKEISGSSEEWHYCKTGTTVDEYVAVSFGGDNLIGLQHYTVSWLDLAFHYVKQPTEKLIDVGGTGNCRLTVRWGTYNQKTPSYPNEAPARTRHTEPSSSAATGK